MRSSTQRWSGKEAAAPAAARSSSNSVTVSALSPTAAWASITSHSGRPVKRSAHARSVRPEISRLSRRPVRKNTAQAASSGGAARRYAAMASTLALVPVVASSAS